MNTVSRTISDETLNRIIQIESAGNPRAKARTSSAAGLAQFINATWLVMIQRYRPEAMVGRTQKQVLDLRFDPVMAIDMLARFTEENAAILPGLKDSDGDLYLAHFSGVGVARRLLQAPGDSPAELYFSPAAVEANRSILEGRTVSQVREWAERKMEAAGGRNWIAKFYTARPPAEAVTTQPIPREARPEDEWTYPDTPKPKKSLVTEGAQIGTGLSVTAAIGLAAEKASELPASVWEFVIELLRKPSFLFVIGVAAIFAYIWWRRKKAREQEITA